jgi:cell division septation protein DedD
MADESKLRSARAEQGFNHEGPAGEARPGGDPLAELARLIGQDDLFDQMRKDAARAELQAAEQQDFMRPPSQQRAYPHGDPLGRQIPPRRAAPVEQYDEPEPEAPAADTGERYADAQGLYHVDYDQHGEAGQPYYSEQHAADPHAAEAEGGYEEESYEPLPTERRSKVPLIIAAVVGLAAVGTAGAFGYRALSGSGDAGQPPVIKADGTPAKIVPARPDGQAGPSGPSGPQGERVVSREEQPLEMKEAKPSGPKMVTTTTITAPPSSAGPQTPLATSAVPPAIPSVNEPKKVRTFAIRPDGTTAPAPAATGPRSAAPAASRVASAAPQDIDPARASAAAPTRTASLGSPVTTGSTGSVPNASASLPAGSYVVQLVSNKSEAEAQSAFKALQVKYPAVLGGRQALIRRVELGDRGTYYRAQVGPFANNEQANQFCGDLKAAGGTCIVQRN